MTFADVLAGTSESYALIKRTVVPDLGCLAYDNRAAVVNKQSLPYLCGGMYFDARQEFCALTYKPRRKYVSVCMQQVRDAVRRNRVKAGIKQRNLKLGSRGRVSLLYRFQFAAQRFIQLGRFL